jgi:arylsulfatase
VIGNVDTIPASEALVRKDWKYFYWPDFKLEQLFHTAEDKFEENDLAQDPAQAARLAEMRTRFAELKAASK